MDPNYDEVLCDIPTGALLMKVMNRAIAGQKPGSRLHWQWCSILEGLMVPLLRSLPTSILDATDPPESRRGDMSVMDRIMIQQKLMEERLRPEDTIRFETLMGKNTEI